MRLPLHLAADEHSHSGSAQAPAAEGTHICRHSYLDWRSLYRPQNGATSFGLNKDPAVDGAHIRRPATSKVNADGSTSFILGKSTPDDNQKPKEVDCNLYNLELGNNVGKWKNDKPGIKYHYDHDLKGLQIRYWWPGKSANGECNNLTDPSRGCWYTGRLLNDPSCDDKAHCLHVAAHDGEPSHTYTCPTWMMNHEGVPCKLPPGWQACPERFRMLRVDSGIPQKFKDALTNPCGAMGEESCLGNTELETDLGMYFDIRQNQWYRCTPWMKCQKFDVKEIVKPGEGEKCGQDTCKKDELCINHRVMAKKSTFHCMEEAKVFVIGAGDDMAVEEMPLPLALLLPPTVSRISRGCSPRGKVLTQRRWLRSGNFL